MLIVPHKDKLIYLTFIFCTSFEIVGVSKCLASAIAVDRADIIAPKGEPRLPLRLLTTDQLIN